ncbi:MAG: hypothetical protein RIT38_792, partial [Bacteroidota bacterium]
MQFVLVDLAHRDQFYPFSLTRSLTEIRVGIMTLKERWEVYLESSSEVYTAAYLQNLYPSTFLNHEDEVVFINATCMPKHQLVESIKALKTGENLMNESGQWIASRTKERSLGKILLGDPSNKKTVEADCISNALH